MKLDVEKLHWTRIAMCRLNSL